MRNFKGVKLKIVKFLNELCARLSIETEAPTWNGPIVPSDMMVKEALAEDPEFMPDFMKFMLDPKAIDGAIRSAIAAHGPVTYSNSFSTTKRVRGAMKTRLKEYVALRKKEAEELEKKKEEERAIEREAHESDL